MTSALCLILLLIPRQSPAADAQALQLEAVLKDARAYCLRLEKAALDFVCREEVVEAVGTPLNDLAGGLRITTTQDYGGSYERPNMVVGRADGPVAVRRKKSSSVYDYQFVRREGKITEKRELLERNGKKPRPGDGRPATEAFKYEDILLAPVKVLDERFREFYKYRLVGTDKVGKTQAWILDVSPRYLFMGSYLGGRVWLAKEGCSILKIEWDPKTFGSYDSILRRAEANKAEPRVASRTEFGFEMNGLRFPSLDATEEAYVKGRARFVRAATTIIYRDYKFFTVETQAEIKK